MLKHADMNSFEKLWALELTPVEEPNFCRGGWSSVCRLALIDENSEEQIFYIKRQVNHLSRSVNKPFGEPTFAREFRNIKTYQERGVDALEAVYYSERQQSGSTSEQQAILITRSLEGYSPLGDYLSRWSEIVVEERNDIIKTVANLIARLHRAKLTHNCLYPKHVYLNLALTPAARFIDLEKTRRQWLRKRECVSDLTALLRRCEPFSSSEKEALIAHYLSINPLGMTAKSLAESFYRRQIDKENRPGIWPNCSTLAVGQSYLVYCSWVRFLCRCCGGYVYCRVSVTWQRRSWMASRF